MYHVEDNSHEDYKQCRASCTVGDIWSASAIARRWQAEGLDVRVLYQSHDAAGMHSVPESEWEV